MPGKSKKGGGLEVSPYTMKGHTLPGPFQKKGSPYKNGKGKTWMQETDPVGHPDPTPTPQRGADEPFIG